MFTTIALVLLSFSGVIAQYDTTTISPPAPPPSVAKPVPQIHPYSSPQQFIMIPISAFAASSQYQFFPPPPSSAPAQVGFNLHELPRTVTSAPIAIPHATVAPIVAPLPITQAPYGAVSKNLRAPDTSYGTPILKDNWESLDLSLDNRRRRKNSNRQ